MTTTRYPSRTPAGAYLKVRPGRRWARITVDRIPITDATPEQADTARRLVIAGARHRVRNGHYNRNVDLGCTGPTIWCVVVPRDLTDRTLAALYALEADDHEPARELADHLDPQPTDRQETKP